MTRCITVPVAFLTQHPELFAHRRLNSGEYTPNWTQVFVDETDPRLVEILLHCPGVTWTTRQAVNDNIMNSYGGGGGG
jgi:hypothetical protein